MSAWKLVQIGTVVAALAIGLMAAGCATPQLQPRIVMTSDGPAAVLTTEQGTWSDFASKHWGKGTTALAGGVGLAIMARNNHWFGWGKEKDQPAQPAGGTVAIYGDNNTVNYNDRGEQSTDQSRDKGSK